MLRGSLLKRILALSLIWVALGFSVAPAAAQDDAMDDVLAGFDESDEFEVDPAQRVSHPLLWKIVFGVYRAI